MSKKASPATIGAFVVGAIVLVVAGLLVFGSGKLLAQRYPWVMYFEGSIKGLNIGAPVSFRGVKIGEVTNIRVTIDTETNVVRTPVFVNFEADRITWEGEPPGGVVQSFFERVKYAFVGEKVSSSPLATALIERGLRAQLQLQSLVTGQLFVQMDFHPGTPVRLVGVEHEVAEFPTIQSGMAKLQEKLEDLPFDELVEAGVRLATNLDRLVTSPEVHDAVVGLRDTMQHAGHLAKQMDTRWVSIDKELHIVLRDAQLALRQARVTLAMEEGEPGRIAEELEKTLQTAQSALAQAETTLAMEKGAPGRLASSLTATSDEARVTLRQSRSTLKTIDEALVEESPLRYDMARTLEELAAAARSIRHLADYLERHPEALLVGKGGGRS